MKTHLIVDTPNILFRVAAVNMQGTYASPEEQAGLALHTSFQSIHKYYKKIRPDQLAFIFEGKNNWRKQYTRSEACVSKRLYKGNRVHDKTKEAFFELIGSFKDVMTAHTSAICLSADQCEGDDMMAGYVQKYAESGDEIIILSGDKDFTQMLKFPNVKLLDPATGNFRNQPGDKVYFEDIEYFIFQKCVRGDKGDNVFSAYPRVRETRIKKAYEDEYERIQFMNETWDVENEDGTKTIFRVGDLYEENKILMDLTCQPEWVKELVQNEVERAITERGKFSNFHFLRFLGQHKLNVIAENITQYSEMLNANATSFKKKAPETVAEEPVKQSNKQKMQNLLEF